MAFFSRFYTKGSLLIGVLIVVYLLPIWVFTYFPKPLQHDLET